MTAERDLILALFRRLISEGALDGADVSAIAEDVEKRGGEDHSQIAHLARLTVVEAAMLGQPVVDLNVERRRKEMVARTKMIEGGE